MVKVRVRISYFVYYLSINIRNYAKLLGISRNYWLRKFTVTYIGHLVVVAGCESFNLIGRRRTREHLLTTCTWHTSSCLMTTVKFSSLLTCTSDIFYCHSFSSVVRNTGWRIKMWTILWTTLFTRHLVEIVSSRKQQTTKLT